jgi:hypothetical protein
MVGRLLTRWNQAAWAAGWPIYGVQLEQLSTGGILKFGLKCNILSWSVAAVWTALMVDGLWLF